MSDGLPGQGRDNTVRRTARELEIIQHRLRPPARRDVAVQGEPGAGAVQDSYTLLRKGIRKVLKTAGFHLSHKRQGLAPEARALLERYVDQDRKADIDWSDPQQRLAQLQILFRDAKKRIVQQAPGRRFNRCLDRTTVGGKIHYGPGETLKFGLNGVAEIPLSRG